MAKVNNLLDIITGKAQTQSQQAASSGIGRSIDSQQEAWSQSLRDQPSTFKAKSLESEDTAPKTTNPLLTFTDDWKKQQEEKKSTKAEKRGDPLSGNPAGDVRSSNKSTLEDQIQLNEKPKSPWEIFGLPVTTSEYEGDYYSRGYYPVRTGEVRILEPIGVDEDSTSDISRSTPTKTEEEKPKKKGLFGITIPDGSENPWDYDATNNIIDTSVPATPKVEEPKPVEPEQPKSKPLEYSDAFLKQEEQKDAWQPTWSNDTPIPAIRPEWAENVGKAAGTGTVSSLVGAERLLYEAGQKGRTAQYEEEIEQLQRDLDRAKRSYEYDKEDGMSEADLQSDLYIIEDIQRKLDAYTKVVDEGVQQEATKATSELSNALQEESSKYTEAAKKIAGDNWLGNFTTDVAVNALQMAGDAAANLVAPGTSLGAMGLRTFGSAGQEADAAGATLGQQLGYATVRAGIEVGTEMMFDGLAGIYGKGEADDIVEELIRKVAKTDTGRTTLRALFGGVGEAIEEGVSGMAEPFAKMIYQGINSLPENLNKEQVVETLYSMLVGFAMGGAGSSINILTGGDAESNTALRDTDAVEKSLADAGVDAYTAEQIAPVVEKALNGEELTSKEKNILMEIRNREDIAAGSPQVENFLTEALTAQGVEVPSTPVGQNPSKASQLETELDKAEPSTSTTATVSPATTEEKTGTNPLKAAWLETGLDAADPALHKDVADLISEAGADAETANILTDVLLRGASGETLTDEEVSLIRENADVIERYIENAEAEEDGNALLEATGFTPTTETNRDTNPNKAAQIETELDKAAPSRKQQQFDIIQEANPAEDDIHTWIRSADEIRTFEEALDDDGIGTGDDVAPDFTREDVQKAIESGEVTVYSQHPIENGAWVTPSRVEAQSYAGDGEVYSATVPTDSVAWVDSIQGMYAEPSQNASESQEVSGNENIPAESEENLKNDLGENSGTEEATVEETPEITPEMEAAERAVNSTSDITDGEQNRIENVLNKTIQAREEASAKAAQTTIPDNTPVDQTKRTTVQTANKSDVRKAARSLITEEESSANTVEVSNKLQQLADYVIQNDGSSIDYDAVERMAGDIADTILDGATIEIDSSAKDAGQVVKDYLKTTPLRFDKSYRNDVSGDFSDFARKYRGKIKFSDSGIGVDVAYMELSEMLPGYFPEDITHPADQLIRIAEVLDEAEPQLVNRYDVDNMYDLAHAELTSQVLDTVLSDVIKQAAPTFADKMYAKLDALKANDAKKLRELREQKNQRMKEIRQQAAEAKREAVAKEKAAKWEKVKAVQDYYRNIIERGKQTRKARALRKKLEGRAKDISDRLTKPKEGHYVPEYLVSAATELLQDLDFNTNSESKAARIDKLQAAYKQLMADPTYGSIMTDPVWQSRLEQVAEYIGGTRVIDMSLDQLQAVYDVVSDLADDINDSVKFKSREESKNIFQVGERLLQQTQDAKNWGSGLDSWYSSATLRPTTYFERLGGFVKNSAWKEMGDVLADGQRKEIEQVVKGSQAFSDLMNDDETATLRDVVSIGKDAAGNDIEISKGMRAALYMHLMNEDNTRHIKYGGLTIPGIEDYYKGNNDSGFGTSHIRALGISPELAKLQREYREIAKEYQTIDAEENKDAEWQKKIDDVVERMDAKEAEIDALYESGEDYIENLRQKLENDMTPIERRWIDTARKYLDEVQNELNDTTLSVYHFKKALVQNYFPIFTDPNFRNTNFESIAKDMSLENSGFMKNRANGANPMLLLDISEVINKYMDKSAKYIGLMPAIRQFNKVYNYTQAGYKDSIKDTIEQKFGKSATRYIEDVIADLTGARKSSNDYFAPFFAKARGHMAQAALSLNPRVALSQAASYMNAASEIGWSPLLKAFNGESNPAKDAAAMDLVTKWSPLEYYRSMGYSTTELGDVKSDSRIENRAMKKLGFAMKWIEMVDTRTVGRLWYAAEAYTQQMNPDLKVGSDEYYQETAKTFNRVVERTQPNYTVMQRPGILRSTSDITKSLTMFMTQRLQNFNILYEAGQRFAQYESDFRDGKNGVTESDLKQAKTDLANAVTSQIASTAMLVALKAGVDVLLHSVKGYRDKDDKLTTESVMSKIADMYADAMLGNLLGGSEAYALAKSLITHERYYGISLSGVDSLVDLFKDLTNAVNASESQRAAKWGEVGKSLAQFFGIPVTNGMKIIDGLRYQAEDIINGNFGQFVAGTDYKTAPDTVTDKEGNKYTLDSQAQKAYSDSYVNARDKYYEQFQSSSYYDGLTDDQKKAVENALNNAAKDKAKYDYLKSQGVNEDNPVTAHEADMTALKTLGNKANGSFAKNKETDYDTLDYIIKNIYPKLSKAEKDELNSSSSYSRYDNMYDCSRVGIDSKTFEKYLNKAKEIDKNSHSYTINAEEYAAYVDKQKGLNSAQRAALKDIYKYTTTLVADTKTYDKWIAAGLSPDDAVGFNQKINTDGGKSITNAERYAAIEQYATDAEMAEKLWEAMNSSTWSKSGKSYFQANPSSKFKSSWSGKTYSTPGKSSSSSSSSSTSTGNNLLGVITGKSSGSSYSFGSSSSSSSSGSSKTNNELLNVITGKG